MGLIKVKHYFTAEHLRFSYPYYPISTESLLLWQDICAASHQPERTSRLSLGSTVPENRLRSRPFIAHMMDPIGDPEKTFKPAVDEPFPNGDEEGQPEAKAGTVTELDDLAALGYKPELQRNRSMFTLLFQSLAIAAVSALLRSKAVAARCVCVCLCLLLCADKRLALIL